MLVLVSLVVMLAQTVPDTRMFPQTAAGAAAWQPIGDVISRFSRAIIRGNDAAARGYLTSSLQSTAARRSLVTLLGLPVRPSRYWYGIERYTASSAAATLTYYFADGRTPLRNHLQLHRLAAGWRIGQITHLASSSVTATAPTPTPAGSASPVIFSLPTTRPVVALTFDDGPSAYTTQVVATLARFHVHATFFVIGRQVAAYAALIRAEVAAGDGVGNHTYSHVDLRRVSTATIQSQLGATQQAVQAAAGITPRWFRPEGGAYDAHLIAVAAGMGLRTVLWSVDPKDWSRPGTATISSRVLSAVRPGSIILLHDGGGDRSQTVAALPVILSTLQAHGYHIDSLGEFFR